MFCARCGKEIDNDSTFCPFCGQRTDEPVESGGGRKKPKGSVKMPGKKVIGGIAVVAAVLLVVFGISRIIGGISHRAKSLPEKLFAMSWEEISEISEADFKDMFKESDILYDTQTEGSVNAFTTKTTETFMKGDCLFMAVPDMFEGIYAVRYETEDDFKEGRKLIESTLEKQLIKKMSAFEATSKGYKAQYYPIGMSDKYLDRYLDQVDISPGLHTFEGLENLFSDIIFQDENYERAINADKIHEMADQYSVYKFVYVVYGTAYELGFSAEERLSFPSDKSYTDQACIIGTIYVPAREESIISMMASPYSYDAISEKEIDIDKFKESVNERLVDAYLDKNAQDDQEYRCELEKELYVHLYMMENHNFDINSKMYLESKDEVSLWYIRNFNWDTKTDAPIDLSAYRNSGDIYCAVECNYNSDTAEYFESELDRALYLADRDYKADTGESFGGTDDKRLWFMQNYSYDIEAGKEIDKEVVDAITAYNDYINVSLDSGKTLSWCSLVYIDDNEIPEAVICFDEGTLRVLSYNGDLLEYRPKHDGYSCSLSYDSKKGQFCINVGYETNEYGYEHNLVSLNDDFKEIFVSGVISGTYYLNGEEVDQDYWKQVTNKELTMNICINYGDSRENTYKSLLLAYDVLGNINFETCEYCIYEYELKDGILTVKADDGAKKSSSFGEQIPFEFSYPVADDCIWEAGNGFGEYRTEWTYPLTSEELEVEIKNWRNMYELTPDNMESPVAVQFHIIDDQVVGVYTSIP